MIIGFTGTRYGMSDKQKKDVFQYYIDNFSTLGVNVFIHGSCIGADIEFHNMFKNYGIIEIFPGYSINNKHDLASRGNYELNDNIIVYKPESYLKRNRVIVDRCDILLACPYNDYQKGGTWYTINYAKKNDKEVIIFER